MFRLNANLAVYLHRGTIDFRKNINGLSAMVEHELRLDPFAHAVYVFGNRRKDRIKILGWSRNGFWLLTAAKASGECALRLAARRHGRDRDNSAATALVARWN
jgi:transposase